MNEGYNPETSNFSNCSTQILDILGGIAQCVAKFEI